MHTIRLTNELLRRQLIKKNTTRTWFNLHSLVTQGVVFILFAQKFRSVVRIDLIAIIDARLSINRRREVAIIVAYM